MSQVRSLAEWFSQTDNHPIFIRHYYTSIDEGGCYYTYNLEPTEVAKILNALTQLEMQSIVAAMEPTKKQNAFHYALSKKLWFPPSYKEKAFVIKKNNVKTITNPSSFNEHADQHKKLLEEKTIQPYAIADKENGTAIFHALLNPFRPSHIYLKQPPEKANQNAQTSYFYLYLYQDTQGVFYQINQKRFDLPSDLLPLFKDKLFNQERCSDVDLCKAVLAFTSMKKHTTAYEYHNDALMRALLAKDDLGNTPLFYCYQKLVNGPIASLLERVGLLSQLQREQLLFATNQEGKTVLHAVVLNWPEIEFERKLFGDAAMRKALFCRDNQNNTVLHDVFLSITSPTEVIQSICQLLKPEESSSEEKHLPVDLLFRQNNQKLNPLHLLCMRKTPDENPGMLIAVLNLIPIELRLEKIMERDSKNYTVLHHACRHATLEMIKQIILMIGPLQLYLLRNESKEIEKLAALNPNFSAVGFKDLINEHNILFDCFTYFETTYNPKYPPHQQKTEFIKRCHDFYEYLLAIEQNRPLPEEDKSFYESGTTHHYHELRMCFQKISVEGIAVFKKFIQEKIQMNLEPNNKAVIVARILQQKLNLPMLTVTQPSAPPPYCKFFSDSIPTAERASDQTIDRSIPVAVPANPQTIPVAHPYQK